MVGLPSIPEPRLTFNPGPGELWPNFAEYDEQGARLLRLPHRPTTIDTFQEVMAYTDSSIKAFLNIPDEFLIAYGGSATNIMNLVPQNMAAHSTLHLVNGAFSNRLYEAAVANKKEAHLLQVADGEGFDLEPGAAVDVEISSVGPELICVTQNETSTGVMLDSLAIAGLKRRFPNRLIAVDATSAAPYGALDYKRADAAFWSVQKGWGMGGMGLGVVAASPEAVAKSRFLKNNGYITGGYQNFAELNDFATKEQTPETPNMRAIYILGCIAADMARLGIETLQKSTDEKARMLYDFAEASEMYRPFVEKEQFRSSTVIVLDVKQDAEKLAARILAEHNILIGTGYGAKSTRQIRIGNFPAHSRQDFKDLIPVLTTV